MCLKGDLFEGSFLITKWIPYNGWIPIGGGEILKYQEIPFPNTQLVCYTSPGRKFALLEGLSHDLKSVPDRFIMSILRGRCGTVNYHPVLNLIN